jgi:DNA mismatch endonuclease (patch repair protein)
MDDLTLPIRRELHESIRLMVDKLASHRRSWNMSRIRSRDTAPELAVRRLVHRLGFRFRLHNRRLPGKPDLVLARHRTVVLVHGCFWHQHEGCIDCSKPGTNQSYWAPKLARNVERDAVNQSQLISDGWKVITVWLVDPGAPFTRRALDAERQIC